MKKIILLIIILTGCNNPITLPKLSDNDTNITTDSTSDENISTESGSETDSNTDSDNDTSSDSNTDSDNDTNSDSNTDSDNDTSSDSNTDSDSSNLLLPPAVYVQPQSPSTDNTPQWSWQSGGDSGTGLFRYKLDDQNLSTGATETSSTSYTFPFSLSDGEHVLYVQEKSEKSEWSPNGSAKVQIDTKNPVISSLGVLLNSAYCTYTTTTSFQLSNSASDATSGLDKMRYMIDSGTWSAWVAYSKTLSITTGYEFISNITIQIMDKAGNVASKSVSITHDDAYEQCKGNNTITNAYDLEFTTNDNYESGSFSNDYLGDALLTDLVDYYIVKVKGYRYTYFTATRTSGTSTLDMTVYSSTGSLLKTGYISGGTTNAGIDNCNSSSIKTYYIKISPTDTSSQPPKYTLSWEDQNDGCL